MTIEDGKVTITDSQLFSNEIDEVKTKLLQEQINQVPRTASNKSTDRRRNTLANLAKLWIPMSKQMIVAAVVMGKRLIRNEPEKTLALGAAWQPTFSEKPFDENQADIFLKN